MKIIRQINNNAALALDGNGKELVVLGRGVGFPKMPYELTDLSRIERTFYDVNPKYFGMAADLPRPLVLACAEITERAEIELDCALNPNLPFTLADHLNFAAERLRKGIEISTPLAYDVRHLYPKETELAKQARELLAREAGLKLPDSEVVNIALHLINAEAEAGDMHSMMMTLKALSDVDGIVEKQLAITLNKESFSYSRFSMHLRYLIQRLASCRQVEERISGMLAQMRREYRGCISVPALSRTISRPLGIGSATMRRSYTLCCTSAVCRRSMRPEPAPRPCPPFCMNPPNGARWAVQKILTEREVLCHGS